MSEWSFNGDKFVGPFIKAINDPQYVENDLINFQEHFGEQFSIEMLIKIYEIQAQAELAAAIYDLPEMAVDQIFKAFNCGQIIKVAVDMNGDINGTMNVYQEDTYRE